MSTPQLNSAAWVAALRARESTRPDRLFDDPYAEALAGPTGFAALAASERASGGENRYLPVRTRFFDDLLLGLATAARVRQVVLLGAGLDTRPYRLALPPWLHWYEIDLPETFAVKEPVLVRSGAQPRCRRWTVEADLRGDWASALCRTGFDPAASSCWLAEGLLFYLPASAVGDLLDTTAAHSGTGSVFAADVFGTGLLELPALRSYLDSQPGQTRFCTDDPAALLSAHGWRLERDTLAGAPEANYGRLSGSGSGNANMRTHLIAATPSAR